MDTPTTLHFMYMKLAATSVCKYAYIHIKVVPCIAQLFIRAARRKRKYPRSDGHIGYRTRVYMKMFMITRTEPVYCIDIHAYNNNNNNNNARDATIMILMDAEEPRERTLTRRGVRFV